MYREEPEERPLEETGPLEPRDTLSLAQIYEMYMVQVYRFIYRHVGNREDAEDLTAQVFLKAIRSLDRARDEESIRGWLFQTARTTLADHWRQFYRTPIVSLEFFPRLRSQSARPSDEPLSGDEVQRILAEDEAFLEYFFAKGKIGAFVLTRDALRVFTEIAEADQVASRLRHLRFVLRKFALGERRAGRRSGRAEGRLHQWMTAGMEVAR